MESEPETNFLSQRNATGDAYVEDLQPRMRKSGSYYRQPHYTDLIPSLISSVVQDVAGCVSPCTTDKRPTSVQCFLETQASFSGPVFQPVPFQVFHSLNIYLLSTCCNQAL